MVLRFKKLWPNNTVQAFLLSLLLLVVFAFFGLTYCDTNDEWALLSGLRSGYTNLVLPSFFYSYSVANLYQFFPFIPWHSIYIALLIFLSSFLFFNFSLQILERRWAALFILASLPFFTYFYMSFGITSASSVLLASSFLMVSRKLSWMTILGFLFLFAMSCAGRIIIEFHFFLLALFFGYFILRSLLNDRRLALSYILVGSAALSVMIFLKFSFFFDPNYEDIKNWNEFNALRFEVQELAGNDKKNALPDDDMAIFNLWYANDLDVISNDMLRQVIKEKKKTDAFYLRVMDYFDPWRSLETFWKDIYFLLLLTMLAVFVLYGRPKSRMNAWQYRLCGAILGLFVLYMFVLNGVRPTDRVSYSLYYAALLFLLMCFRGAEQREALDGKSKIRHVLMVILVGLVFVNCSHIFVIALNIRSAKLVKMNAMSHHLKKYQGYNMMISVTLPLVGSTEYLGYELFQENRSLWDKDGIVPHGYLARHPSQLEWLKKRGYKTFYDMLVSDKTRVFAFGASRPRMRDKFSEYLDRHFSPGCRHQVVVDGVEDFITTARVTKDCSRAIPK